MDIVKIIGVGIATAIAVLILRQIRPEIAAVVGIVGTVIILFMVIAGLSVVISAINSIAARTGIKSEILSAVLKIVGIGYLCEIGTGICRDADSSAVADMVTLGGKILILVISIPIIEALIEIVLGVLP